MRNFRRLFPVHAASLALIFLLPCASPAATDDWTAPARELARKIAQKLEPGERVTFSAQNLNTLPPDEAAAAQKNLETELRAQGFHLAHNGKKAAAGSADGPAELRVTLAENSQGLLWVAEINREQDRAVVMQIVPRTVIAESFASPPAMVLRSEVLLVQKAPILDFAVIEIPTGSAKHLLVLEPGKIGLFAMHEGRWQFQQETALLPLVPPQRGVSGRFAIIGDSVGVVLPGEICGGVLGDTLRLECRITASPPLPGDEQEALIGHPYPLRVERAEASYSVARFKRKGKEFEVDAGKDGLARLFKSDEPGGPLAVFSGWGSEIAGLKSPCGSGWQVLVTRPGDDTERDAVQAFEIADKQAVPASPPDEFAGPVKALHTSGGHDAVFAVVMNLQTGQYEAHVLTLSCDH